MSAQTDTPRRGPSEGLPPNAAKAAPRIDLAAGLIPKRKVPGNKAEPKIDLLAGLVPKAESAAAPSRSAARRTAAGRAPADTAPAGAEQVSRQGTTEAKVPPPIAKPINPLRDVVRRASAAPVGIPAEPAAAPQNEPLVLAVDGAPQGIWGAEPAPVPDVPQPQAVQQNQRSQPTNRDLPQRPAPPPLAQPVRGREPQPAPASPPYVAARREPAPASAPAVPRREPAAPPAQPWERLPNPLDRAQHDTADTDLRAPQPVEAQYNAATRMTGLKNLIQTLGMKNPPRPPEPVPVTPLPVEPVQQRPVYPRAAAPIPQAPTWKNEPSPSPTLVTAPPEFLPPKPLVEKTDKENSALNGGTSRRDRRETYDDVEILPSWRGQYKRR